MPRSPRPGLCDQPPGATAGDLAPHPPLADYYAAAGERPAFVRRLFDETAQDYDRINRLLSLGAGGWYRRRVLRLAGLAPGMRVLDVACGTGLVAREAQRLTGDARLVIGLDASPGMLLAARRRFAGPLVEARMEHLPIASGSMALVSMGYALRHAAALGAVLSEFHRVLRPGGRLVILEIARPSGRRRLRLAKAYLGRLIPLLSRWATGRRQSATLMRYYWQTIETCVPPETILGAMRAAGFSAADYRREFDLFLTYTATKPGGGAP